MNEPMHWSATGGRRKDRARRHLVDGVPCRRCSAASVETEPRVQAWARLEPKAAREDARQCDEEQARGHLRGPLHGVADGIKDNFDTAGLATEARVGDDG